MEIICLVKGLGLGLGLSESTAVFKEDGGGGHRSSLNARHISEPTGGAVAAHLLVSRGRNENNHLADLSRVAHDLWGSHLAGTISDPPFHCCCVSDTDHMCLCLGL